MRAVNRTLDALTWVLAALGIVSVIAFALSAFFGVSIVLFATNSMAPTMPQGSAALAIRTPASEVRIGDVVTVDQRDELPISHRVVKISPVSGHSDARSLLLKGDNNASVDASAHTTAQVRRIFFAVPGAAPYVKLASNPRLLFALGLVVAGLIVRAFIPSRKDSGENPDGRKAHRASRQQGRHRLEGGTSCP